MEKFKQDKAIVLASGGMDSLVTIAEASLNHNIALLHVTYGQRTAKRELKAFTDIADFYSVEERMIVSMENLKLIGGSSLTDNTIQIPEGTLKRTGIPNTYVPFRNAHLIATAVSWAEVLNAKKIFIGVTEQDSTGYPDCRKEFYELFNKLIKVGTKSDTEIFIETPLIDLNKGEIVRKGIELEVPFQLSWSCYRNNTIACGNCDSCLLRLKGFQEAGIKDPVS